MKNIIDNILNHDNGDTVEENENHEIDGKA